MREYFGTDNQDKQVNLARNITYTLSLDDDNYNQIPDGPSDKIENESAKTQIIFWFLKLKDTQAQDREDLQILFQVCASFRCAAYDFSRPQKIVVVVCEIK